MSTQRHPGPPKGVCVECERMVGRSQTAVYAVTGYASERAGGGFNHVLDCHRVDGQLWHEFCFNSWLRRQQGGGHQEGLAL